MARSAHLSASLGLVLLGIYLTSLKVQGLEKKKKGESRLVLEPESRLGMDPELGQSPQVVQCYEQWWSLQGGALRQWLVQHREGFRGSCYSVFLTITRVKGLICPLES